MNLKETDMKHIFMINLYTLLLISVASCGSSDSNDSDNVAPEIISISPENLSTNITVDSEISVVFSESISGSDINTTSFSVKEPNHTAVPGQVTYNADTKTVSFVANGDFKPGMTYKLSISQDITDTAGNPLDNEFVSSFTTEPFIVRASLDLNNAEKTQNSFDPAIDESGHHVFYRTYNVFTRDMLQNTSEVVSITADGVEGHINASSRTRVSDDGRYVVFNSGSFDLNPVDNDSLLDIYVKDMETGSLDLLTVNGSGIISNGASAFPDISNDGRYVVFRTEATNLVAEDTNTISDLLLVDRETNSIQLISTSSENVQGNDWSDFARISGDGRYVSFMSNASNLVANDNNATYDIFRKDLLTGETIRVSTAEDGTETNGSSSTSTISSNGRYILFESEASNLVANDTNGVADVFVKDMVDNVIMRVSTDTSGVEGNTTSTNPNSRPGISADGRFVTFYSTASNLVINDTNGTADIFVKDITNGEIARISVSNTGEEADGYCYDTDISGNGRYILFDCDATNLVEDDTNGLKDIFRAVNPLLQY